MQPAFGRRRKAQEQAKPQPAPQAAYRPASALHIEMPDAELEAWKQSRRFVFPWRQVSLMAGLCFAIASFVLPDSVGDVFVWILYGLSGASFYVSWRGRRTTA
ncbi:MAG TPA: hypothetical protein VFQ52_05240 [Rhizomicrobium sp.]|nr:hypothetical protein [Rhizomicrobium sp.]